MSDISLEWRQLRQQMGMLVSKINSLVGDCEDISALKEKTYKKAYEKGYEDGKIDISKNKDILALCENESEIPFIKHYLRLSEHERNLVKGIVEAFLRY